MHHPALEARSITKKYGSRTVLDGLSLIVEEGAFEALMGPSGSGKSTFLHIAAGLVKADSGDLSVGGESVSGASDARCAALRRRKIGVVFQAFNLLEDKTVMDNVLLPAKLDGRRPDASRISSLLETLGLSDLASARCRVLSGGEKQRVAVARALSMRPALILADEPTGNLDAEASRSLCALLARLNAETGVAILMVTHDPVVAACARTVRFLRGGKIAASFETQADASRVSRLYLENCK